MAMTEDKPLMDSLRKREKLDQNRNMNLLAAGATPLLAGLLVGGDIGDAAEIASGSLDKEMARQQDEDKSLLAYLKKKQSTAAASDKKRYQQSAYEDEAGNIKVGVFDTATGQFSDGQRLKGLSPRVGTDPVTGELSRTTKSKAGARSVPIETEGRRKAPFVVKEEKDVERTREKFNSDKLVQASKKAVSSSNRAIELLQSNNPVSDEGIKVIFPRMFGEVGNLAVQEQERFSGSPELRRRFDRLKTKWSEGTLTDEDRSDLLDVARVMGEYDRGQLKFMLDKYITSESERTGIAPDRIRKVMSPMAEMTRSTGKVSKKIKKKPIEGNVIEKRYKGRMRKFKKVQGGWELIK